MLPRNLILFVLALVLSACEPNANEASASATGQPSDGKEPPPSAVAKPHAKPRPFPGKRPDLARFQRNRVGSVTPRGTRRRRSGAQDEPMLKLVAGDDTADAAAEKATEGLGQSSSKEKILDALAEAAGTGSAKLPELLKPLLSHPDAEVREMILASVAGYDDPALLPLAAQGLRDRDANVRQEAVEMASSIHADGTAAVIALALRDQDINVRQIALQSALDQPAPTNAQLIRQAATAPAPDLAMAALSLLESMPDKQNVPLFIQALNHPNVDVRESAAEVLALTFHQSFQNAGQASSWWSANQGRFSQELVEETVLPEKP